jgi:S-formylglutathione hydrolase
MSVEILSKHIMFGGQQLKIKHISNVLNCSMIFSLYLPPVALTGKKVPMIYWLSGLTCTDDNFVQKAGAQRMAAQLGVAIVCPDTSPRGAEVPGDPDNAWDFGLGAGFYLKATQAPWHRHYNMYDYIVQELPGVLALGDFPVDTQRVSIMGHSMGGHGALTLALKNPGLYQSVSAFSPICAPTQCPWGIKAFTGYLGEDQNTWRVYDTCALLAQVKVKLPLLVDQGQDDPFLQTQLKPELLQAAALQYQHPLTLRLHAGYDHSYFFIASFIDSHIQYHAQALA